VPDCLCPSFGPHRPGCAAVEGALDACLPTIPTSPADRAAAKVRRALATKEHDATLEADLRASVAAAKASIKEAEQVLVFDSEDGPKAPNQLLHALLKEPATHLAVAWRDKDGFWTCDWSDCTPGELLEAATAMSLDAQNAFAEVQDHIGGDEPE